MGIVVYDYSTPEDLTPDYANTIIKEERPDVNIKVHLNTAYIYFNFPSSGIINNELYRVSARVVEYGSTIEGYINREDIKSDILINFNPTRGVHPSSNEGIDNLPRNHAYLEMNNSWYEFTFIYMNKSDPDPDGSDIFYSKGSKYLVDNTAPVIFQNYISSYIKGDISTTLRKNYAINVQWDKQESSIIPTEFNIIKIYNDPSIKLITKVYIDNSYTTSPLEYNFNLFITRLFNDANFLKTLLTYFEVNSGTPEELPQNDTINFIFLYNRIPCSLNIDGNIYELYKKYKRI